MSITEMKNRMVTEFGFENIYTIKFFKACEQMGAEYFPNTLTKLFETYYRMALDTEC